MTSSPWLNMKEFEDHLVDKTKLNEDSVKCEFLDIPCIYHYEDENFSSFFE
jgi:hypothetical protein